MAGDNLNVWYDPEGDHLEIVFDQKAGYFEGTSVENVMRKRDSDGNLLAISIFNLSSFPAPDRRREVPAGYDVWATFNLDADLDNLLFPVALGYERFESDSESASSNIPGPEESVTCSVFAHADASVRRPSRSSLVERKLEIVLPKSPYSELSARRDRVVPEYVTSLSRDQLVLALRLFKGEAFWVWPWKRRHEGRERAYTDIRGSDRRSFAPYVLRGREVIDRFLQFAKDLRPFHVDRNRYRRLRYDYLIGLLGPDVIPLMAPPDDPTGAKFMERAAHVMIAADFFEQANGDRGLPLDMRLLLLVMAAEALFSDDDKSEVSYRLATRIAFLNGANATDTKRHWDFMRLVYEARSKLMHGAAYVRKRSKRHEGLVDDSGFIEISHDRLLELNNLVRASILYFIAFALQDLPRRDVLAALDKAVFDRSDLAGLRSMANQHWGLGLCEEEMLCSQRWVA
jgi:hypothetical protein